MRDARIWRSRAGLPVKTSNTRGDFFLPETRPDHRLGARGVLATRVAGDAPITRPVRPLTTACTATRACRTADPERGTVPSTTTEIANGVSCCGMLLLCHAATRPARPCAAVQAIGEPPIVSAHSPNSQSLPLR